MVKIFIIIIALLIPDQGVGQSEKESKAIQIDILLTECNSRGIFNGVALVTDGGEIILHKGYGVSDRKEDKHITLSDRFYIGSITKQFTAVLILKLQDQNVLSIGDPISKYLPEFKEDQYKDINIHHLLTHTSGIHNYTSFPEFNPSKDYTEKEMINLIKTPLVFEPGSKWNYSNSGYYLLGKISERVSKKSYGELMDENIFTPLQMNNTAFDTSWLKNNIAKGYWRTINGFSPMPKYSLHTLFASGGIYSTAEDLYKWDKALYGNQLLSDASKEILFSPVLFDYACGWYVKKGIDEGGNYFERHFHGGMIKGYHTFILRRIPSKQLIVPLDNSYSQEIQDIKNRIWSVLIKEPIKDVKPKLSNLLFDACANNELKKSIDTIKSNPDTFENTYIFEEYDINTVGYRLMDKERYEEAEIILRFNLERYPDSWNVYDSMGELQLKMGNMGIAEGLYVKSLDLNPDNISAKNALRKLKEHTTNKIQ